MILKRKTTWVKRYAKIEHCMFSYTDSQADKKFKAKIDLRQAKVMLGQKEDMSPYIYIQKDPFKAEAIRITFDNDVEFNRWLDVVQTSRKSDKEVEQAQKKAEEAA